MPRSRTVQSYATYCSHICREHRYVIDWFERQHIEYNISEFEKKKKEKSQPVRGRQGSRARHCTANWLKFLFLFAFPFHRLSVL